MSTRSDMITSVSIAPMSTRAAAGIAGLTFAATIVLDNVVRASSPSFAASPQEVANYFADQRALAILPLALLPVGLVALFVFVAGLQSLASAGEKLWSHLASLGVPTIAALFGLMNVIEIAVVALTAHGPDVDATTLSALWVLHSGAFGLNLAAIGISFLALSRIAFASGMLPLWYARAAWVGSSLLLVSALFATQLAQGVHVEVVGLVGFLLWFGFLIIASSRLLRRRV